MKEVKGKYNRAKIFTDDVEKISLEQVRTLCDQPFSEGSKIRLMPDIHAGAGCTIGTTMTISDMICADRPKKQKEVMSGSKIERDILSARASCRTSAGNLFQTWNRLPAGHGSYAEGFLCRKQILGACLCRPGRRVRNVREGGGVFSFEGLVFFPCAQNAAA